MYTHKYEAFLKRNILYENINLVSFVFKFLFSFPFFAGLKMFLWHCQKTNKNNLEKYFLLLMSRHILVLFFCQSNKVNEIL